MSGVVAGIVAAAALVVLVALLLVVRGPVRRFTRAAGAMRSLLGSRLGALRAQAASLRGQRRAARHGDIGRV